MLGGRAEPGGDEERSDLVAVQADGVGLVVDPGSADMYRRRVVDQALFFGVAVEAGHGAQPSGDGGGRSSSSFEVAPEGLDVAAADLEKAQVALVAEGDELAQVQGVGVAGEAPVAAEEPGQCYMFRIDQTRVVDDDGCRRNGGHGIPPESLGLGRRGHRAPDVDETTTVGRPPWPAPLGHNLYAPPPDATTKPERIPPILLGTPEPAW